MISFLQAFAVMRYLYIITSARSQFSQVIKVNDIDAPVLLPMMTIQKVMRITRNGIADKNIKLNYFIQPV